MMTLCNDLHPKKTLSPIEVTEFGIIMLCNDLHPEQTLSPIEVTESGIVTLCNDEQREKALSPIEVTDSGIMTISELFRHDTSIPLADISRLLIILKLQLLDNCNFTLRQLMNGFPLNKVTESGIVTLCNDLHPEKALTPTEVTETGIVTLCND